MTLRQPARTGPFGQSCLSALDRWKKPGLKAMVNQEILTIQLKAWLKLSALLQPVFSSGTVWGGDSKVTSKWSERKGAFAGEREWLTADSLGSQPKETAIFRRHLLLPTSNKPN